MINFGWLTSPAFLLPWCWPYPSCDISLPLLLSSKLLGVVVIVAAQEEDMEVWSKLSATGSVTTENQMTDDCEGLKEVQEHQHMYEHHTCH